MVVCSPLWVPFWIDTTLSRLYRTSPLFHGAVVFSTDPGEEGPNACTCKFVCDVGHCSILASLFQATPSFSAARSHELLHRMTGQGLGATYKFTRSPCIYSSTMISVELTLNNTTEAPVTNIHVGEQVCEARRQPGRDSSHPLGPVWTGSVSQNCLTRVYYLLSNLETWDGHEAQGIPGNRYVRIMGSSLVTSHVLSHPFLEAIPDPNLTLTKTLDLGTWPATEQGPNSVVDVLSLVVRHYSSSQAYKWPGWFSELRPSFLCCAPQVLCRPAPLSRWRWESTSTTRPSRRTSTCG